MRKTLLILSLLSLFLPLWSEEENKEHWNHHLENLENYIQELQEWKKDVDFDDILDQQIELIKEKSKMIQDFISNKIKDDKDLDIKLRLLDAQLEILYLKVSLLEVDNREKNKDDAERLKEIYSAMIELKEAMLKLQKKESELILELNKIKRNARIKELERELEELRGE